VNFVKYTEEKSFTLRLELQRSFAEEYDGEEDGYEWVKELGPVLAEIVQVAATTLRRHGWQVRAGNRGRPSDEEVLLVGDKE
jgi:hypothetical protein